MVTGSRDIVVSRTGELPSSKGDKTANKNLKNFNCQHGTALREGIRTVTGIRSYFE